MEDAGGKGGIGMSLGKDITKVLLLACSAACNDGDDEFGGKAAKGFAGKALLHSVVVHAGEEYFPRSTVVHLPCPFKETALGWDAAAIEITHPPLLVLLGIYGYDTHLTAKVTDYLVDKLWPSQGGTVDAYFVGSSGEHPLHVGKFADSATDGKGDVYLGSHFPHHVGEGLAAFVAGGDVEENQFVCALLAVNLAKLDGIARLPKLQEVRALDSLAVFDIEAGYDSLC